MGMMAGGMDVKEEKKGDVLILRIKGRLDAISAPAAEKKVFDCINSGNSNLILDVSGVDYLSSAGMRMLLSTTKKLKSISGRMILFGMTNNVMDVLKMSGFDHVLELCRTEEEALHKF